MTDRFYHYILAVAELRLWVARARAGVHSCDLLGGLGRLRAARARELRELRARLAERERHNRRVELKWAMLWDADWRGRVLLELGGEAALRRWEACWTRLCVGARRASRECDGRERKSEERDEERDSETARAASGVRTDRSGCFRLPALPRRRGGRRPSGTGGCAKTRRPGARAFGAERRERPIPVWPEELRGRVEPGAIPVARPKPGAAAARAETVLDGILRTALDRAARTGEAQTGGVQRRLSPLPVPHPLE